MVGVSYLRRPHLRVRDPFVLHTASSRSPAAAAAISLMEQSWLAIAEGAMQVPDTSTSIK